ncbi:hypothetical protein ACRAWD_19815 [Caulobacter segnis]
MTTLSEKTITVVEATVPSPWPSTARPSRPPVYARLFQDGNLIRALFSQANQESGAQVKALAGAVLAYAKNIDNLGVPERGRRAHGSEAHRYNILPEHYPYVAHGAAGRDQGRAGRGRHRRDPGGLGRGLLGPGQHPDRPRDRHPQGDRGPGGRLERLAPLHRRRRSASAVITSFVLRPQDGGKVVAHKPGQYLTFTFDTPAQRGCEAQLFDQPGRQRRDLPHLGQARGAKGSPSGHLR